jgi:hypothetical protein
MLWFTTKTFAFPVGVWEDNEWVIILDTHDKSASAEDSTVSWEN